ncbi:peptidase M24, structural domain-containing protein [Syncephalis fuscata]|nr:peptidase M24, structural domain-containing protein [Syncephalis fuscata]
MKNQVKLFELEKYRSAATVVMVSALNQVLSLVQPGISVLSLCQAGDQAIQQLVNGVHRKVKRADKGVAWPTCVSVNHAVQHVSPLADDTDALATQVLVPGDLVKIDMAAHIDGYIATAAHTTVTPTGIPEPTNGPSADAVCAAYYGAEVALRHIRPGQSSKAVIEAIQQVADCFKCNPVEGTASHLLQRYVFNDGQHVIPNYVDADNEVNEFEFEANQIYSINIVMSSGQGLVREHPMKTGIYQRNLNVNYQLRLQSSRALYTHVTQQHPVFPFAYRTIEDIRLRAGLNECLSHDLLVPYVALCEKSGGMVAQYKLTVVCTPDGPVRLTTSTHALPYVHSAWNLDTLPELAALIQTPVTETKNDSAAIEAAEGAAMDMDL